MLSLFIVEYEYENIVSQCSYRCVICSDGSQQLCYWSETCCCVQWV